MANSTFAKTMEKYEAARNSYSALLEQSESGEISLESSTEELATIKRDLEEVLAELATENDPSNLDELVEATFAATVLLNAVNSALHYSSNTFSC